MLLMLAGSILSAIAAMPPEDAAPARNAAAADTASALRAKLPTLLNPGMASAGTQMERS